MTAEQSIERQPTDITPMSPEEIASYNFISGVKNIVVQAEIAARDQRMRDTLIHRKTFYETVARLASANLQLIDAFEYVDALKPGENDYGRRSILNHYPEIIETIKTELRELSNAFIGTPDFGHFIDEDIYDRGLS